MDKDFLEKRKMVVRLVDSCPFGKKLHTCPANEIRKLPIEDRFSFVGTLSESNLDTIINFHEECSSGKAQKHP